MRIPLVCVDCLTGSTPNGIVYAIATLDDDGHLSAECENGHTVRSISPKPNHEWLTSAGAFAILDGYYREAVASFAAALESSFAFYVEVSLHHAGLELELIREMLRKNRQDQRRIGMVSACYLRDTGKQFPYLQDKWTKLRNNVVHNGHWPPRATAIDYADYVCAAIADLYQTLGPALEPHYHHRVGELVLSTPKDQKSVLDDSRSFLSFYMSTESMVDALLEFAKHGPHRTIGGPRLVK